MTVIGPVVAPGGTLVTIVVAVGEPMIGARVPLVPIVPLVGVNPLIVGGCSTVNVVGLVADPSAVETVIGCGPRAADAGTTATTAVGLEEVTVAAAPPNVTTGVVVPTFNVVP